MATGERPLSPHLFIYRWQITMMLSITHRFTGVGLGAGALILTYWLASAAYGPEAFARAQTILGHPIGLLFLLGWTFVLFFHLCNGIRHLFWDSGVGFEMSTLRASGWFVMIASVVLTVGTWWIGYGLIGGS